MEDVNPKHHQIDLYTLRSFQEYDLLRQTIAEEIKERKAIELNLISHDQADFLTPGFCVICGCESLFKTNFMYTYEKTNDGNLIPNWRENLNCVRCGFTNRIRAAMHIFYQRFKPASDASIYITEQTTPLFKWLKQRHSRVIGSEYFADAVPFGKEKDGLRNEDLTALTFPDNSFDYILSFDVMEHVSDDIAALREVYRCLRPGGTFIFTAPFSKDSPEKSVRARLGPDGSIEHILPPEYHSNPIEQENGSLCFRYFAWDLLEDLNKVGFQDPRIVSYWSRDFAYLGGEQFIFIANRGPD
jgi:SAM-dependent methyltransferase